MVHELEVGPVGLDPAGDRGQGALHERAVVPERDQAQDRPAVIVVGVHLRRRDVELAPQRQQQGLEPGPFLLEGRATRQEQVER